MNYVIIDDENKGRNVLQKMIATVDNSFVSIGEADSVESGVQLLMNLKPDILFLDVEMKDGLGFDILDQLTDISFQIIFTTAYDHYAIKAFKFNAIDYILKPVDQDDLEAAIQKAKDNITKGLKIDFDRIKSLIKEEIILQNGPQIAISDLKETHFIKIKDIVRCEASSNYTTIYLLNGSKIVSSKTLREFENQFIEHNFLRVHNSHLINLCFIKALDKNSWAILENGDHIEVSRRKKNELLNKIQKM